MDRAIPHELELDGQPGELELDRVKSEQHRARFSAQASVSASRVGNDVSLGVPVVASIELARGKRIGYLLDSRGHVAGKIIAKLAAPEADSAIRHYQQGSNHYYLLDWGPLARPARQ